jgi:hypothetical protein
MNRPSIVDAFPDFAESWRGIRALPVRIQVREWEALQRRSLPELLSKQKEVYRSAGVSWRRIAETRVFPALPARWGRIVRARRNLLPILDEVDRTLRGRFRFPSRITYVVHMGIGCGAGWATTLSGSPAILFGLENLAELNWTSPSRLRSHVAHELGHIVHTQLRARSHKGGIESIGGPYGQLYVEGFATRVESEASSRRGSPDMDRDVDWANWCQRHHRQLAKSFLDSVRRRRSVRRFFGSWYEVGGHIETGYWLGWQAVRALEADRPLREVASLDRRLIARETRRCLLAISSR